MWRRDMLSAHYPPFTSAFLEGTTTRSCRTECWAPLALFQVKRQRLSIHNNQIEHFLYISRLKPIRHKLAVRNRKDCSRITVDLYEYVLTGVEQPHYKWNWRQCSWLERIKPALNPISYFEGTRQHLVCLAGFTAEAERLFPLNYWRYFKFIPLLSKCAQNLVFMFYEDTVSSCLQF